MLAAAALAPQTGRAAPYAAMVMDARTGEIIHSRNAETRLHPASLTKMMTLYIAFQAIERGELGLDTEVRITSLAANEPPSRLGLQTGQTIRMRYLIRAAAIRSANDAATAIGIAISGSEDAFARRMNATAQAMGMTSTTFRNANGLTQEGHMSTAHDMTILGRHMIYDFPQYYNLFSRRTADAGIAQVTNTNRRFLDAYEGADGIKTGFTNAAGFNLVASAQRGDRRIIATVFGGTSTADRNARVAELLDMGFAHAPSLAPLSTPEAVAAQDPGGATDPMLLSSSTINAPPAARTIRTSGLVTRAVRPESRPGSAPSSADRVTDELIAETLDDILGETAEAPPPTAESPFDAVTEDGTVLTFVEGAPPAGEATTGSTAAILEGAELSLNDAVSVSSDGMALPAGETPREIIMSAADIALPEGVEEEAEPVMVSRLSTSGGHHWGINVGRFNSQYDAERHLVQVTLNEAAVLSEGLRRVIRQPTGFDANVLGLTREDADLACRRLQARGTTCFMLGTD
ncbi:D-alanyl-D-alanine carboxypeptidase family protein [Wenxinia saemankumensis]|nr:D-alanyl-D-alanine carboxypeptidase family protein [Wenxinia saemankumensis]